MTILGPGQRTPAPWINVIANPAFGFHVAAEGGGTTWSVNSRENQLTPWSNDPVTDRPGEAFYLRDDITGELWSPTALPIRDEAATYVARHGRGYSRFQHTAHGIASDLIQFVPLHDPIKISRLRLRNTSERARHISVTAYVEWVLGPSRSGGAPFVTTEIDAVSGAMFARNAWSADFGTRVAFADLKGAQTDWTGDRREFIGRNGTLARPAALAGAAPLRKTLGAGLDPCGALRTTVELPPHGSADVVFLLGQAADADEARSLIAQYRAADLDAILSEVGRYWDDVLGAVQVKTPDRADGHHAQRLAALPDHRLPRLGALGVLSVERGLRISRPAAGRHGDRRHAFRRWCARICCGRPAGNSSKATCSTGGCRIPGRACAREFPTTAPGSHSRPPIMSSATGDAAVLDEVVAFLEGPRLAATEHEHAFQPTISDETGTLYEHCARGLDQSLALGAHGLPLIGTGDWNDGMNRVGAGGQGESVWLGWLLYAALTAFAPFAEARHDSARAAAWRAHAAALQGALEREAWDGDWYRRGWFDDGTAFGSAASAECRIDSIAQSWSVLSGAGERGRAVRAMAAVEPRAGAAAGRAGAAVHPAVRSHRARSRLHQGLPAGRPRERRPIYPRRVVVRDGICGARAGRRRRRSCSHSSIRSITPAAAPACNATRWSPMWWRRTSIQIRAMSDAAAGPGTAARPDGCSAPASRAFWGCGCRAGCCISIRASRKPGRASR